MAIFLLLRPVSDRFIEAAKGDPHVESALLDDDRPAPEWHVNAVRAQAQRREGLAKNGLSFAADAREIHDLGGAWDGLMKTLEALAVDEADVFRAGTAFGEEEESGVRALTSAETTAAVAALERIERATFEQGVRRALADSRGPGEQRHNPFTGQMQTVGPTELYGARGVEDDEFVRAISKSFDRLRAVAHEARDHGFGLALQIVL